ncbi:MAG: tRNA 2-thiocytidine(32) synthetase TtcA [Deltaproteobacteria bacterium]|nr:tRNA 2-thiocytidine(32) synthetase TtcA [Deltaproteobacteria bacterium]MBW2317775.1 tRNA 2-thiocytidine(32) synthetase TtcA [Deltaproteobacteria bacterium]
MSRFRDRTIRRAVGQALHQYNMIADGDTIAVGLSGGKDSLTLMWALHERLRRIPIHYSLFGIYIDLGFTESPSQRIERYCAKMDYSLRVEHTDYGIQGHSAENRENPCFLCARLRRKRLFEIADELGCNKLALGHNMDDIIETLFLNMCYSGEISTMVPCQPFFGGKLVVIRPLAYVHEQAIARFAQDHNFPDCPNPCPTAKTSKRSEIKEMLNNLYQTNKKIKGNIFRSMSNVKHDYLLKPR